MVFFFFLGVLHCYFNMSVVFEAMDMLMHSNSLLAESFSFGEAVQKYWSFFEPIMNYKLLSNQMLSTMRISRPLMPPANDYNVANHVLDCDVN